MFLYSVSSLCSSLSAQISLLKQSLELQLSQSQSALQQLQSQFNQERELLSQQLKGEPASNNITCTTKTPQLGRVDAVSQIM